MIIKLKVVQRKKRSLGQTELRAEAITFQTKVFHSLKRKTKSKAYIGPEDRQSKDARGNPNKSNCTPVKCLIVIIA